MMPEQNPLVDQLIELAKQHEEIAALWLYGSRARGDHYSGSDYDIAVAFTNWIPEALERRLRPELLAMTWQEALELPDGQLSVVDLATCPVPLGWSILSEGKLLLDRHPQVRMTHESRILSRWELDYSHRARRYG
ncbi:nucleotidyltransferase domain-containing protein [Halomonas sp. NO4]|uniref:type VII toxin-antitoxin system MntA family adenylyltransferase antitoxin n=1 Tax=Halomonas sp. NO4 TaxID=2484813 RepID=UPI0013D66028|nr:nucleotidyltransferase domain-containing protein [Halomonas sp. NO4]